MDPVLLSRLRARASQFAEAELIVLFGSVARDEAPPSSDADIGVAGVSFWRALEIADALAACLRREAHAVELDRASDWLRYRAAREGVLLAARHADTWPRFRAEAALRYFDLQPIIARCAAGARARLRGEAYRG